MIYYVCFTPKVCDEAWDRQPVKLLERRVPRLVRVLNDLSIDYLFGLLHYQSLWWGLRSMTCDAFGTESDSIVQIMNDSLIDDLFCLLHFQSLRWGLGLMTYGVFGTESMRVMIDLLIDDLFCLLHFQSLWWGLSRWHVNLLERKVPRLVGVMNNLSIDYLFLFASLPKFAMRPRLDDLWNFLNGEYIHSSEPMLHLLFMLHLVRVINDLSIDDLFCFLHFQSLPWDLGLVTYGSLERRICICPRVAAIPAIHASHCAGYELFIDW